MYIYNLAAVLGLWLLRPSQGATAMSIEDGPPTARLLVKKEFLNKRFVQNLDLIVTYTVYNAGTGPASDVTLTDSTFPDDFRLVSGYMDVKLARISQGMNVSHTVVFRPRTPGTFNVSHATVTYMKSSDSDSAQVCLSSSPPPITVTALPEHERKYNSHLREWGVFSIMALFFMIISKHNGFH